MHPTDGGDGKASAYNAGDPGSIPGSGRSPGEGSVCNWEKYEIHCFGVKCPTDIN